VRSMRRNGNSCIKQASVVDSHRNHICVARANVIGDIIAAVAVIAAQDPRIGWSTFPFGENYKLERARIS
jgi:hypothetical protein